MKWLALLASAALPLAAQAAVQGLCATPQSNACQQARAAHKTVDQQLQAQQQRVEALSALQTSVGELWSQVDRAEGRLRNARQALDQAVAATVTAQAGLRASATDCAGALAAATERLAAASGYRDAAAAFARAPGDQAANAAAGADRALDLLSSRETQALTAADHCGSRLAEADREVDRQADSTQRFKNALESSGQAGAEVRARAGAVATAGQGFPARNGADIARAVQSTQGYGQAVEAWAAAVTTDPAQVAAAIVAAKAGPPVDPSALLAASRNRLVADDALAFWRLTAESRTARCGSHPDCVTDAQATREQRAAGADRTGAEFRAVQAQSQAAVRRLEAAAAAAQPDAPAFVQARTATALEVAAPVTAAERARLDAQLETELGEERLRLAQLERVEAEAYARAFGLRLPLRLGASGRAVAKMSAAHRSYQAASLIAALHAHQFISGDVPEPPDYAAYTYVYLAHHAPASLSAALADNYRKTLISIVATTEANSAIQAAERHDYNLFCVPNAQAAKRNAKDEKPGDWLLDEYDHAHVEHLLFHSHSGLVLREIVGQRVGFGPYLLTTFRPFAQTRSGDRLLYVDLSDVPAGYIPDLIESYKQRFRQAPPTEERTEWKPSLAQAVVMNVDRFGDMVKQLKSAAGWDVAKTLGGDAKQAFVKVEPGH